MTVCPNGHKQGAAVRWDANAGTGTYCITCGAPLNDPPATGWVWPAVAVVAAVLLVCGFFGEVFALW